MKRQLVLHLAIAVCALAQAASPFISFTPVDDAVQLQRGEISFSAQDDEGVIIAINNLKSDMQKTIGFEASLLVGTVGKNPDIDKLLKQGLLPDLKGKREKYLITTLDNRIVIAGSDRRGTIYGIYELSRQLGVSPWYWWADVPVAKHDEAYIIKGTYTDGEPAVEFRGIFLNDEAPCLTSWVKVPRSNFIVRK